MTPDLTQRLLTAASEWAAAQATALPDGAKWSVGRRLDIDGFDLTVAVSLHSGVVRLFTAGEGGPELRAAMPAEAAE